MRKFRYRSPVAAVMAAIGLATIGLATLAVPLVAAHESRELGEYTVVLGFIAEPVYVGNRSGLEFFVNLGEEPVEGLEETLQAEVVYGDDTRELPLSPRFGEPGAYQSYFIPTAAGPYTFHIFGTIGEMEIDETFTSSEEGFNEVQEVTSGQFPVRFPTQAELAARAEQGAAAAGQATLALALGGLALLLALIALGLSLARRRRA